MLGHNVNCVRLKSWFVFDFLATKVWQSSSETHASELPDFVVLMLPRWIFRTIQRRPRNASLISWCPLVLRSSHLCAPEISDDVQLERIISDMEQISNTSGITHRNSVVGNIGRAINDCHILESSFQAILENKSNFELDGPKIQVALQKFAQLETISRLGVAKYSEAVDEAMVLLEKCKPSMYPQATAVE